MTEKWETFCDECYYGLWRVRRKDQRNFNDGFHLQHQEEAEGLVRLLNDFENESGDGHVRTMLEEVSKMAAELKAERDKAIADRDIARLAALDSDKAHDRMVGELEKVYKERDEAREVLEYIAHAGLSARHIEDYAKDFLRRKEAAPSRKRSEARELAQAFHNDQVTLLLERDEARGERDALRDAVNALHDYVHGKRNDDKDISEILNGAMKI